ncbi:MAG: hypothetical protein IT342_04500 [Candidatus Melainabacteria bacterium]|nr:hypothetical protein [Candidatus Melainabacteria bacterium]
MSQDPCGTIEKLVRQFYPKAVINKGRGEITFEYKSKKKNGFYPDRPAMVPMDGGIVGTVTLSPGEYAEADKDEIPSEKPNGFYMVLTMAPYSKRQNSHLLAKVIFPEDINSEFKEKFRSLIKSFNATDQPPVTEAPKPENTTTTTTTTTPAADTEAKPKPSYAWAVVVRPDYRISFKFPQKFTVKDSPDKSSTTWRGNAEGVDYTVTVHQPTAACISDEQRTQAMTKLVSGLIQGKKSKLEQSFNFQGLTAQQYAITDGSGITSKVIVCISAGLQYMFVAGGPNYKASKLPPEFFDGIKIGKVK